MKPILFNTDMVRAITEGRKTATRRLVKPQPIAFTGRNYIFEDATCPKKWEECSDFVGTYQYQPGDILYIRETWRVQAAHRFEADARIEFKAGGPMVTIQFPGRCSDSHERPSFDVFINKWMNSEGNRWRPSIFMPKEAARIFLRVTDVRVERLQKITDDGAIAEGVRGVHVGMGEIGYAYDLNSKTFYEGPVGAFANLWNSTIKPKDRAAYGWDANPFVWVIEFERCDKPED